MNLAGKHILVVGLGESGLAMAKWLDRQGATLRVVDSRLAPPNADALQRAVPDAELVAGPFADAAFAGVDLIAMSPGVALQEPCIQRALACGTEVISEVELFVWGVRAAMPQARILAITGSNGKTTTTALTAFALNKAGIPTKRRRSSNLRNSGSPPPPSWLRSPPESAPRPAACSTPPTSRPASPHPPAAGRAAP